jgi:two-component system chemotaxis sensor kinase CheA
VAKNSDKALREFLSEAQEIVETLNRNLLALDEQRGARMSTDPELINDCFRAVHSLKGLSGLFGLGHITDLAHCLENLLDDIRLGKQKIGSGTLDLLFEAVELFGESLGAVADGRGPDRSRIDDYLLRLGRGRAAPDPLGAGDEEFGGYQFDAALLSVLTEYEEHRLRENIGAGRTIYRLNVSFELTSIDTGIEQIKQRVKPVGEIITYLPSGSGGDADTIELSILVGSELTAAGLREVLEGLDIDVSAVPRRHAGEEMAAEIAPAPAAAAPGAAPSPPVASAAQRTEAASTMPLSIETGRDVDETALGSLRSITQSVRVDIRKLDTLMNAVGELGLVHAGLSAVYDRLLARSAVDEARALAHEVRALERKLLELQQGILEVRMVPMRQIFDKLSRVVRKIARVSDKEIRLQISGAETELDKLIVEELSDPLMHIIRNAIDHGIESVSERRELGKPEIGTVSVEAIQQGNRVIVTVRDDGRGIDEVSVAEAAVRKGIVDRETVAELSRRELLNLLFLPGMSTRQEATELSGRGVGLDVVKTNIANLSGIIDLTSTKGHGTQVAITLPITLAIIQAIVVRVAGRTYAIPLNSVVESLMIWPGEIRTIEGREVMTLRNQTLRLARAQQLFRLQRAADAPLPEQIYVVVVGVAQHRLGMVVDELVGQQDIVIKSLGRTLSGVRGIAGATELRGQGTVLVMDVPALVEETINRTQSAEAA